MRVKCFKSQDWSNQRLNICGMLNKKQPPVENSKEIDFSKFRMRGKFHNSKTVSSNVETCCRHRTQNDICSFNKINKYQTDHLVFVLHSVVFRLKGWGWCHC